MTLVQLKTVLDGSGLPVAYNSFPEGQAPALPFVCYLETGTRPMGADDSVYFSAKQITIELYEEAKDPDTEAKVEEALSDASIFYTKTEAYLDDERCFEIIYEIEV